MWSICGCFKTTAERIASRILQRSTHHQSVCTHLPRLIRLECPSRFAFSQLVATVNDMVVGADNRKVVSIATIDRTVESNNERFPRTGMNGRQLPCGSHRSVRIDSTNMPSPDRSSIERKDHVIAFAKDGTPLLMGN